MGSAALAQCARRGVCAIGLEQFARGHELGSFTGKSRLIRKAYFEDPAYVPLLQRAYELWRELEQESGEKILQITGLLTVGRENSDIIQGTQRAAREFDLAIELLSQDEITRRYPTLRLVDGEVGIFESDGGVLKPERTVAAHLKVAENRGAQMRFETSVQNWRPRADHFELELSDRTTVHAHSLILSLGAWHHGGSSPTVDLPLRVQRNVQVWFTPATNAYDAGKFPPFLVERAGLPAPLYGFPDFGDGVKAAFHGAGDLTDPRHFVRDVDMTRDVEPLARALEQWMPGAAQTFREATPCMYALTPDEHFVVDHHPQHPKAIVCGGFSGHGFKFAPVIGEIAVHLALDGGTTHDIAFLSSRRFAKSARPGD